MAAQPGKQQTGRPGQAPFCPWPFGCPNPLLAEKTVIAQRWPGMYDRARNESLSGRILHGSSSQLLLFVESMRCSILAAVSQPCEARDRMRKSFFLAVLKWLWGKHLSQEWV